MSLQVEDTLITKYEQLTFSTDLFMPMLSWMIHQMSSDVVIFKNGNILLTHNQKFNIQKIVAQMASHFLVPNRFFMGSSELVTELLDGISDGADIDTLSNNALRKEGEEDLSAAQEDLRNILAHAVRDDVSDIHLEIRKETAQVRFRKFGQIYSVRRWNTTRAMRACFVAFNRESDDVKMHFNSLIPHDASMELQIEGQNIRARLASIPAYPYPSCDVVIRILTLGAEQVTPLEKLEGYTHQQRNTFAKVMKRKSGAIIMAGATGSGKTTTLAALVQLVPSEKKIYTIEDPVEKRLTNATQIPTNNANPLCTFAMLTRQTLRMDPDCIVIGEVRDEDTAHMMARAAITGHLVLSTLHANSAINIILRLHDLGLPIQMLTDPNFLSVAAYQTLIRKLCPKCKMPTENPKHRHLLGAIYKQGDDINCLHCNGSGVSGRVVAAEVIPMREESFTYIRNNHMLEWMQACDKKKESIPFRALQLIRDGIVSLEDAQASIGNVDLLQLAEKEI